MLEAFHQCGTTIPSSEAHTLASYPGAVIMVSHDSDFAEQSGVNASYQLSCAQALKVGA
ncbi:hypothetical protein [Vibrio sinaloensis]|uniref:hypothetical protein n=1 Tax=Photobacterium sp. (strain ATCC 43367) TaxID=379097 RepID=UPI00206C23BD|nr:hypothetical protein [Vibrio sinaloensis]UPQ90266.1 hypothetical protein MTO69_16060 [Vibrio sinaloensis]